MNLEKNIRDFLSENFNIDVNSNHEVLISTGKLDSMQVMDVALFIEQQGNIQLEQADMSIENFETVAAMVSLIENRKAYHETS